MTSKEILQKINEGQIDDPNLISEYITYLSAELIPLGKNELARRIAYASLWSSMRTTRKSNKECDMAAMGTKEYQAWELTKVKYKGLVELIRGLKKRLFTLSDEWETIKFN